MCSMVYKRVKGWTSGRSLPICNFCWELKKMIITFLLTKFVLEPVRVAGKDLSRNMLYISAWRL